jgi:hypothetical protein
LGAYTTHDPTCPRIGCDEGEYDKWRAGRRYDKDVPRDDPELVKVVEELGDAANGRFAQLEVVEIPADVDWFIDEYDGSESIHEKHRSW